MKLIKRIIIILVFCILAFGASYLATRYLEKNAFLNTNLLITFEDTKEFSLEDTKELSKEEALETYPYIFTVENKGFGKVNYKLILKEIDSEVDKENLDYVLFKNDKEVGAGTLNDLKDDLLYTTNISLKATDTYKLYVYFNTNIEEPSFKYSIIVESQ